MVPMLTRTLALLMMLPTVAFGQTIQSNDYLTIDVGEVPTLNAAACDTATEIDIELSNPRHADITDFLLDEVTLYVWWDESGDCDKVPDSTGTDQIPGEVDVFVDGDTQSTQPLVSAFKFIYPNDMVDEGVATPFTTATLLGHDSMCPPNAPLDERELTLCFGLDLYEQKRTIDNTEPWGGVTFIMDTKAPETPHSVSVSGSDGGFQLTLRADDVDNDIASWQARVREQPPEALTDPDYAPGDCELWEKPRTVTRDESGSEATISVTAANGMTYEACARTRDRLENVSAWSDVVSVTPQEECDFIECYSGNPQGCTAAGFPVWGWSIALLGLRLRLRRARTTRELEQ
ncbi:MAG: hypothetical protein A2289_17200 [Deltaproteobacteria bacterium RIFOXYA12_FULL_58_15]|nr:MAG: hypothetical protein A2289_17200 [Deltaproteobacteria bacterium RIFOXYA12_FULL_58_15]OGR13383.1 MAG: hypothetical protein A2341_19595 [Deltaproteobacteria bacterium RIFOXYB12_FULL_58_9]